MTRMDVRSTFEERWTRLAPELEQTLPIDATIRTDTIRRALAAESRRRPPTLVATEAAVAPPPDLRVVARHSDPPPVSEPPELPSIHVAFSSGDAAGALLPVGAPAEHADYTILRLLGEGGMGAVHLARERSLDREVAVKLPRGSVTPDMLRALLHEARLTGALEHPNIVPVHALGRDRQGRPVLVMKRVEGVAWRELLRDPDHPAWSRVHTSGDDRLVAHLEILMQVCNALHFAHSRSVVHRDVKPENVMIGEFGEVYLLDWGVALRLPDAARGRDVGLVGTPAYMAPEMVFGSPRDVDARTDVFLLGATLHEVLTGRLRHEAATLRDTLLAAALSEPVTYGAAVPPELGALCNAATSRDPAARPPTAAAFRQALADFLRHRSSRSIAASARRGLEQLEALRAGGEADPAQIGGLLIECRFGFLQALREWSGNEDARRGLKACLERMIEREIAQRNPAAARALLPDLPSPDPALAARIDALEAELDAAREREALHARQAKELDASVSARTRFLLMSVFLVVSVALSVKSILDEMRSGGPQPMEQMLTLDVALLLVLLGGLVVGRRRVLANMFNRRIFGLGVTVMAVSVLMDVFAWTKGLSAWTANVLDMMMLAACFAIGGLAIAPRLFWASAVTLGAALTGAFVPVLTTGAGTIALAVTVLLLIEEARRSARRT